MRTCLVCGKINNMFQGDPLEFSDDTMICCKCANVIADDINHLWDLKTSKELDNAKNCIIEKAQKNYEAVISKKIIEKINYTVERIMQNLEPHEEVNVYKELFSYIEPIYSLDGKRGKHLDVYEKKVVITTNLGLGSLITGNATDGMKVIYFKDIIGLQYKNPGTLIGYIQFETAASLDNNTNNNFYNENTFTFDMDCVSYKQIVEVFQFIEKRVKEYK